MPKPFLRNSKIIFLFGKPGSGKTTVGRILEKKFDIFFYDADDDLTPAIRAHILHGEAVTDAAREEYYRLVVARVRHICSMHRRVAVAVPTMTDAHRMFFLSRFPGSRAVFLDVREDIHEKRFRARTGHVVSHRYWKMVGKNFVMPAIGHMRLINNGTKQELALSAVSLFGGLSGELKRPRVV